MRASLLLLAVLSVLPLDLGAAIIPQTAFQARSTTPINAHRRHRHRKHRHHRHTTQHNR